MGMIEITLAEGITLEMFYKVEDCGVGVCGDHPELDVDMQPVFTDANVLGTRIDYDLENITEHDMERASSAAREDMGSDPNEI